MPGEKRSRAPRKACCLVSELLEEAGVDREKVRQFRRQVLQGVILLCQWQLQRLESPPTPSPPRRARRVSVE